MAKTESNFWRRDQQQLSLLLVVQLPTKLVTWWRNGNYLLTTLPSTLCKNNLHGKTIFSSRIYIHCWEGIGQSQQLLFLLESRYALSYTPCLTVMTCVALFFGQASFVSVLMICPIDQKKFAPNSCSVAKTTWKNIIVQH